MSEFKRDWPKRGSRQVRGFYFGAEALNLSLEATGLAAHIYASESDEIDEDYLKLLFPGRDLSGPLRELMSIGLIEVVSPESAPAPVVEVEDVGGSLIRAGTIYLVEGGGRFKIGITKATKPTARLRGLQTGSPVKLRLVYSAFVADSVAAESLAHGLLARFRLHGEWFECSEDRARSILDTVIDAVGLGGAGK